MFSRSMLSRASPLLRGHASTIARHFSARSVVSQQPNDVGIVAIDTYLPKKFVSQSDLEKFDQVSEGKYTIGLGQAGMAFCGDNEDIASICLTVTKSLTEKYGISFKDIGRLEVGTETLIDKSKSVKSTLMQLFESSGNTQVDGIDTINACYGGTAALMNAVNWVYSPDWDGRYALVVCGDIAIYEPGPARPSGGAGAVAMLVGRDAPIVLETGLRSFHMEHAYDFYKPALMSEYPVVDGALSNTCYIRALDECYSKFAQKWTAKYGTPCSSDAFDYIIFHSPYNKLVQKAFARLRYHDFKNNLIADPIDGIDADLEKEIRSLPTTDTYTHRAIEKAFIKASKEEYEAKVAPTTYAAKNIGNTYTAAVYTGLASLLTTKTSELMGKRVGVFSYGSGLASSIFSMRVEKDVSEIARVLNLDEQIKNRERASPEEFTSALLGRESFKNSVSIPNLDKSAAPISPVSGADSLKPGTFYLSSNDRLLRRSYERVPF